MIENYSRFDKIQREQVKWKKKKKKKKKRQFFVDSFDSFVFKGTFCRTSGLDDGDQDEDDDDEKEAKSERWFVADERGDRTNVSIGTNQSIKVTERIKEKERKKERERRERECRHGKAIRTKRQRLKR
jgi:hypothetical protein